jgi:hypothetical protein
MDAKIKGMLFTAKVVHMKMKLKGHKIHKHLLQLEDGFSLSENSCYCF